MPETSGTELNRNNTGESQRISVPQPPDQWIILFLICLMVRQACGKKQVCRAHSKLAKGQVNNSKMNDKMKQ